VVLTIHTPFNNGISNGSSIGDYLFHMELDLDNNVINNNNSNNQFNLNETSRHNVKYNTGFTAAIGGTSSLSWSGTTEYTPTSANSEHLTGMMNFSEITKIIRIVGLMALISYMVVILFTWVYANLGGYVYFQAGEPMQAIKYSEWALGITGIFVAFEGLLKEIA
jgi:hypothetical protein